MTHAQLTRFECNRCDAREDVLLNDQPPPDWRQLWDGDITKPPMHLCATCAARFDAFLERRAE